ncbi:unnamed protein product [Taenia asiatica]|uniref:Homeobox domain-containing protein n=1 Tax=Taenia asiatica TaxID=60517 RepID=A0A158R7U2_TAEAS|nr:unnamed protein product [Taenia asiatica]
MDLPQATAIPTAAAVEEEAEAVCFGCGAAIYDPFIMHVQPDLKWHGRCLKCHKCERGLSDETSCFVRNGKAYCREDYCNSSFLQRCAGCQQPITKVDLVLRIRNQTFHMGCFRCVVCSAILQPGEEIAYRRDMPYCLRDAKLAMPEKWDLPPPTVSNTTTLMESDAAEPKVLTLLSPVIPSSISKSTEDQQQQQQQTLKLVDGSEPATYLSPQPPHRTRSDSTSSSLDGPMGENDVPMTPNSEGSQDEDDCSSLFGCMTSAAVSCLSGDASQQQTNPALNGETPSIQSATNSTAGHNHLARSGSGGGKSGGKRSKEQKTTRVWRDFLSFLIFLNEEDRDPLEVQGHAFNLFETVEADNIQSAVNRQWYEDCKVMLTIDFYQVRTVLNEKQLHMLRTCYAANPRPDALMKEQLVEMTGLSPRVIRVWFQNKRCKDKKKQIMIKQMEQHHQNGLHPCGLQGVPMVAGSPLPNDPSMLCSSSGIEVQRIPNDNGGGGGGGSGGAGGICSPGRPDVSSPPPPSQPRFSPAYPPPPPPPPPPSHLFNGMLPPISHVEVKPPLPQSSSSSSSSAHLMLSSSMGLPGADDGPFPPFQQLVSTFDLMDPLQRGQPGHEDGFTSGSRLSYGPPGGSGAPSNGPPAPTAVVDGSPFVFPMGDPTFTTLRPISLRPPSLST